MLFDITTQKHDERLQFINDVQNRVVIVLPTTMLKLRSPGRSKSAPRICRICDRQKSSSSEITCNRGDKVESWRILRSSIADKSIELDETWVSVSSLSAWLSAFYQRQRRLIFEKSVSKPLKRVPKVSLKSSFSIKDNLSFFHL